MVIAMLAHVDLCSGIGGFALGFQWAGLSEPVLFCDIEAWSRQVLAKHWPDVPIAEDVKELASDPARLVPDCDILTAGYPCQPFSQAGVRRGEEDDRHIWPEIFTIVQAKRPAWCVFENVSGHISLGLDQVLSDLESKGYAVQPFVVPACAVDAPHRRDRVWIVANSDDAGQPASPGPRQDNRNQPENNTCRRSADVADASRGRYRDEEKEICTRRDTVVSGSAATANVGHADSSNISRHDEAPDQGWRQQGLATGCEDVADANSERGCSGDAKRQDASDARQLSRYKRHDAAAMGAGVVESSMGGVADGLSTWLDEPRDIPRVATGVKQRAARLKGLGNAIVPQIAMQIGLTIKAVKHG